MSNTKELRTMTCAEFADELVNDYFFDNMIEDAHWEQSFRIEPFYKALVKEATKRMVRLSDLEEFDAWDYFANLYDGTEKGLS